MALKKIKILDVEKSTYIRSYQVYHSIKLKLIQFLHECRKGNNDNVNYSTETLRFRVEHFQTTSFRLIKCLHNLKERIHLENKRTIWDAPDRFLFSK